MWSRLKNQADNALNMVNKSLQDSTTSVVESISNLAKSNYFEINQTCIPNKENSITNNEVNSNGVWNSMLTNVKSSDQINSVNEAMSKNCKLKNLEEYFQEFYKSQMEDKEFTKWDLNVILKEYYIFLRFSNNP